MLKLEKKHSEIRYDFLLKNVGFRCQQLRQNLTVGNMQEPEFIKWT
uniref:Uncharacterized protein n=1 Tax=Setaria viridis TaxID=4556 RepID=A0A4U6UVR8_SETVI|nr:hypothetical protein SEVIR_5G454750v2 [Setaria viridis]